MNYEFLTGYSKRSKSSRMTTSNGVGLPYEFHAVCEKDGSAQRPRIRDRESVTAMANQSTTAPFPHSTLFSFGETSDLGFTK